MSTNDSISRATRRIIEGRDFIEAEANNCKRTQSWSPRSTRSAWWSELQGVVDAIDVLRTADAEEHEAALVALEEAIDAANDEAKRLAQVVAEIEAKAAIECILRDVSRCGSGDEVAEELRDFSKRSQDGDRGWSLEIGEGDVLTITGWSQTRVVTDDNGNILLGSDWSDLEEETVRGRVQWQITRDDDDSDEPNGLCMSFAEGVAAVESLAQVHGLEDGWEHWSLDSRWCEVVESAD